MKLAVYAGDKSGVVKVVKGEELRYEYIPEEKKYLVEQIEGLTSGRSEDYRVL